MFAYLWGLHDLLDGSGLLVKATEECSGVGGNNGDEDESEGGHGSGGSEVGGRRISEGRLLVVWRETGYDDDDACLHTCAVRPKGK